MLKVTFQTQKESFRLFHQSLQCDIASGKINFDPLIPQGKINSSPEAWAIDTESGDDSYLYESEFEYFQDLALLEKFCETI